MLVLSDKFKKSIVIIRSKRSRRITLRVCQLTGKISLTIPLKTSIISAKYFLNQNADWINCQLSRILPTHNVTNGSIVPIEGIDREIVIRKCSKEDYLLGENKLFLDCNKLDVSKKVKEFLLNHAAKVMTPIIKENAKYIGKKIKEIRFKDTKSRWGSCSSEGSIMINWRLVMAPKSVYKYVIVHEVAHLEYMNHSPEFWNLVKKLYPNYFKERSWLKTNGIGLKRFLFEYYNVS